MTVTPLPLSSVAPDPTQPRSAIPDTDLDALTGSIQARGLLIPLRVTPADAAGRHLILSGHRRHAALVRLGRLHADCIISDGSLDEADALAEQLTENLLRENLSPVDEADGYRRYLTLRGTTAAQAAADLHVDPARVSRALALLDLSDDLRALIHAGRLAKETGYYLSRLPAGDLRDRLFAAAAAGTLSRDAAAAAVKSSRPSAGDPAGAPLARVTCKLGGGRTLTVSAAAVRLDTVIDTLEVVLREARKARRQGWDVSTLARVLRDRAGSGGDG